MENTESKTRLEQVNHEPINSKPPGSINVTQNTSHQNFKSYLISFFTFAALGVTGIGYAYLQSKTVTPHEITIQEATPNPTILAIPAIVQAVTGETFQIVQNRKIEIIAGDQLNPEDIITTAPLSNLTIQLNPETLVKLGEKSQMTFTNSIDSPTVISILQGDLYLETETETPILIKTPFTDMSSAAGNLIIQLHDNDQSIMVFAGSVKFTDPSFAQFTVAKLQQHQLISGNVTRIRKIDARQNNFITWALDTNIQSINTQIEDLK